MAGVPLSAAKDLLGGMSRMKLFQEVLHRDAVYTASLNGHAILVGGITLDILQAKCQGSIKVPRACPGVCFPSEP